MKPSKEQIAEWIQTADGLDHCLALAYAAGRKAGMEEAVTICERMKRATQNETRADAADMMACCIRAAMEADT